MKMKAVTCPAYGQPNVLEVKEIDKPVPQDHEVLVRVHAATVNRTDCGILTASPFILRFFTGLFKPRRLVPGTDFGGIVEETGSKVTAFKIGDRVWGFQDEGLSSYAQYMCIAEDKAITTIPEATSYEEAAASGEGAHYAYNFINKITLQKGDKVLVNGATGAIGSAALQLLKHFGAQVTAVGNTKNLELLKSLGADRVIDYEQEDFTQDKEAPYQYVLDAVGKSSFGRCKHLLAPGGAYISSELGPGAENLYLPLLTKLRGDKRVIFPVPSNCRQSILLVKELIEKGEFKAVIDRTYPMEEIQEAFRYVMSGQKTGNVIVNF